MKSDSLTIQKLLTFLNTNIAVCTLNMNAQSLCNAIYGLQNMSTNHSEVMILLNTLANKCNTCIELLSPQEVGHFLYGLSMKNNIPIAMMEFFEKQIQALLLEVQSGDINKYTPRDYLCLYQNIVLSCYNNSNNNSTKISNSNNTINDNSNNNVDKSNSNTTSTINNSNNNNNNHTNEETNLFHQFSTKGQKNIEELKQFTKAYITSTKINSLLTEVTTHVNATEKQTIQQIEKELKLKYPSEFQSGVAKIEKSVLLHGFECDMVFYLHDQIINYEIDGNSHLIPSKVTFTQRRDHYLQKIHQIKIERKHKHFMKLIKVNDIKEYKNLASKVISNLNLAIDKQIAHVHLK
jgi:hypothetical protein